MAMSERNFHTGLFVEEDRPALHEMSASLMHRGRIENRRAGIQQILAAYA
jgi:hypothetical protein